MWTTPGQTPEPELVVPYVCSRSCSPSQCRGSSRSPARSGRTSGPRPPACRSTGPWWDHTCLCRSRRRYTGRYLRRAQTHQWLRPSSLTASIFCNTSPLYATQTLRKPVITPQQLNAAYYEGCGALRIYAGLKCRVSPAPQIKRRIERTWVSSQQVCTFSTHTAFSYCL